jgi:hypothetical protein
MKGSAGEDQKMHLAGGYTSTYDAKLPAQYMAAIPAAQRAMLSGSGSGSCEADITIEGTTATGSETFNSNRGGSTSKGSLKMEKVAQQ